MEISNLEQGLEQFQQPLLALAMGPELAWRFQVGARLALTRPRPKSHQAANGVVEPGRRKRRIRPATIRNRVCNLGIGSVIGISILVLSDNDWNRRRRDHTKLSHDNIYKLNRRDVIAKIQCLQTNELKRSRSSSVDAATQQLIS